MTSLPTKQKRLRKEQLPKSAPCCLPFRRLFDSDCISRVDASATPPCIPPVSDFLPLASRERRGRLGIRRGESELH